MGETLVCNTDKCVGECIVSKWGAWGACSEVSIYLSGGTKTRTRVVVRKPKHGVCPDLEESVRCTERDSSSSATTTTGLNPLLLPLLICLLLVCCRKCNNSKETTSKACEKAGSALPI